MPPSHPRPHPRRGDRAKSVLLALVLIGIVAYFALTAIPSAERPTLRQPSPSPGSAAHTHAPAAP